MNRYLSESLKVFVTYVNLQDWSVAVRHYRF